MFEFSFVFQTSVRLNIEQYIIELYIHIYFLFYTKELIY